LLGLPGELRNRIYRYALVQHDRIIIDKNDGNGCMQPGILRVCRQLRQEITKIYYEENTFRLNIYDCRLEPQPKHWIWKTGEQLWMSSSGEPMWSNLIEWMRRIHKRQLLCIPGKPIDPDNSDGLPTLLWRTGEIATELHGLPWAQVEKVLEKVRDVFNAKSEGAKIKV
jgi:hypothetical protein